ncbi:hypothetical protein PybrP1_003139 [[Pythium] brassicae (nom. inval.)]|nr:hypothetical protein PybrP1_003139 [[Pythium] brassicae (nom. inval.)]
MAERGAVDAAVEPAGSDTGALFSGGASDVGERSADDVGSESAAAAAAHGDEEEEEPECRVCRGEAEPDRRLFEPCKCSGSIRYTHSDCLEQWLEHSGKAFCELCGHKFAFTPLYDAGAPAVLPWSELVATVARIVCLKWLPFGVRALLVVVLWLGVAPWCTSWLYRMWLLRASAMVNVNFSERFDRAHVVADIFAGLILVPLGGPGHGNRAGNDPDPQLDAPFAQLHGPRRLGNLAEPDSDDSSEDDGDEWAAHANPENPFRDAFLPHPLENVGELGGGEAPAPRANELRRRRAQEAPVARGHLPNHNNNDNNHNADNNNNRNNRPAEPPRRPRNARNNNRPPHNANDWDDDFEHMEINIAVDELLGLRGDFVVLFRNVSWLLAFNGAYLGLFAFIPYTLGSTLLSAGAKIMTAIPFDALPFASAFTLEDAAPDAALPLGAFTAKSLQQAVDDARKNGDCLQLVDLCTCLAGYASICLTIVLWRFMVTTASSYIHRPLMGGLLWALRCLTAIVKVTTLLLLKMVVLPILLGVGIDFATLRLFDVTAQARIAFCMQHMVGSLMVHWVLGITFMLFVTVSVLQLREVVHPDILAKVIRPQEDHPDLLRTLLSEKCVKHARRMLLSLVIYSLLLLVLVHVPVRAAVALAPSLFPLELRFQHLCAEVQVPLELLGVHLVVLGVLEHAKNDIGRFQHVAIAFASQQLGLAEFLLPRIDLHARAGVGTLATDPRHPRVHVLPPPPLHFHPRAQMPPAQLLVAGRRYLPWPEDGLEDAQPMEYDLLPRRAPAHVHARLAGLLLLCWFVCVVVIGALLFGTLVLGRLCIGPFERLTGIAHEPLVMAAGVQLAWYIVNSVNALRVLTMAEDQVEAQLVARGYRVKHMTPVNAIAGVVGWAFVCPLLVGYLLAASFPAAQSSWTETFWMGYLVFNLAAWLLCCFRMKPHRHRRHRHDHHHHRHAQREVERLHANFVDLLMVDDDDDRLDDDDDDDLEDDDEDLEDDEEEDDDDVDDDRHVPPHPADGAADPEDFVSCLRKSFRQLMFTVSVHENDAVRLRRDGLEDRCFDVGFFHAKVLRPAVVFLALLVVGATVAAELALLVFACESLAVKNTAFGAAALAIGAGVGVLRSHAAVARWTAELCESIRNERYLIGRQLQDLAR